MKTETTKSANRLFCESWDTAAEQAAAEYPKPHANGFYNRDKNESARLVRRWQLIVENGLPDSVRDVAIFNLNSETYNSRSLIQQIAEACGIKTARVPTKSLINRLLEAAAANYRLTAAEE